MLPITSGPTPSITTSAWPSSSDMTAVIRSTISRCAGVCTRSTIDSSPSPRAASEIRLTASRSIAASAAPSMSAVATSSPIWAFR